ncbi:MAG: leucyl/phenylalanyl-tRNA--protein transferase [Lewinellaceae bacterium]|nr:leucyl/phenylalanyl-tRNA--protein transferase [Lewinellaceae bacterium]
MPIFWLSDDSLAFPDPALANKNGLLAVGGDLSPERVLLAYQMGIFPWFNPEDHILWWSPDPRFVLFPAELKIQRSMRPYLNQAKFRLTFDQHFETIMRHCGGTSRPGQQGTWISDEMVESYVQLHRLGYAHSVEVWDGNELAGGLYGIALGKCFFGESMFTKVSNASKYGFITLVRRLEELGYAMVDCQQQTRHLASLGARPIPREKFLEFLQDNVANPTHRGNWSRLLDEEPPFSPSN